MNDSSMSLIDCIKANDVTMDFIELKLVTSESLQVSCTNKSVWLSHHDDIQAFLQALKNSTIIEALKLRGEFKDEQYLSCQVVCAVANNKTTHYKKIGVRSVSWLSEFSELYVILFDQSERAGALFLWSSTRLRGN
jgi:hypothetical protein